MIATITMVLDKMKEKGLNPDEWQLEYSWYSPYLNDIGFHIVQGEKLQEYGRSYEEEWDEVYETKITYDGAHGWTKWKGVLKEDYDEYDYIKVES